MLYNLNTVLSHSAKGTTWTKHKYVKKENGKYYYPKNSKAGSAGSINTNGKEILTKVGNRWYNLDEINAQKAKLDAADKYNEGAIDETEYRNAVDNANRFENTSNSNLSLQTSATKLALNASESAKEFIGKSSQLINKGKDAVANIFSSKKTKKSTRNVQDERLQAREKTYSGVGKFNKSSYKVKRTVDGVKSYGKALKKSLSSDISKLASSVGIKSNSSKKSKNRSGSSRNF